MKTFVSIAVIALSTLLSGCQPTQPFVVAENVSAVSENSETSVASPRRLDLNDVSILFPLPKSEAELAQLIAIADVHSLSGEPVFPEVDFQRILDLAQGSGAAVKSRQIRMNENIQSLSRWHIAGIRFDPAAPGGSQAVMAKFGQRPQIRLVLQPVTVANGRVTVHDVALHIIYDFIEGTLPSEPGFVARSIADEEHVKAIVDDLLALKRLSEGAGVPTDGRLSVHPGLASSQSAQLVASAIGVFLSKHLDPLRFNSAALMGLHNDQPEPWIFLSLARPPIRAGSPGSLSKPESVPLVKVGRVQMLSFLDEPNVFPVPSNTNRNALSNNLLIPQSARRGVSTSGLFSAETLNAPAVLGVDASGEPVMDETLTNADIPDWIANPEKSHFFNTDCLSCHTETTRRRILKLETGPFAFKPAEVTSGLDPEVKPRSQWNVRNFGWFQTRETITQRTANETVEVVHFINASVLAGEAPVELM